MPRPPVAPHDHRPAARHLTPRRCGHRHTTTLPAPASADPAEEHGRERGAGQDFRIRHFTGAQPRERLFFTPCGIGAMGGSGRQRSRRRAASFRPTVRCDQAHSADRPFPRERPGDRDVRRSGGWGLVAARKHQLGPRQGQQRGHTPGFRRVFRRGIAQAASPTSPHAFTRPFAIRRKPPSRDADLTSGPRGVVPTFRARSGTPVAAPPSSSRPRRTTTRSGAPAVRTAATLRLRSPVTSITLPPKGRFRPRSRGFSPRCS